MGQPPQPSARFSPSAISEGIRSASCACRTRERARISSARSTAPSWPRKNAAHLGPSPLRRCCSAFGRAAVPDLDPHPLADAGQDTVSRRRAPWCMMAGPRRRGQGRAGAERSRSAAAKRAGICPVHRVGTSADAICGLKTRPSRAARSRHSARGRSGLQQHLQAPAENSGCRRGSGDSTLHFPPSAVRSTGYGRGSPSRSGPVAGR